MTQAKVIFNFEGIDVTIQCLTNEKMKDICQRYSNKIGKSINELIFLYGGNQLNYNINFKEQANVIDRERNIMKVLVYKKEQNENICSFIFLSILFKYLLHISFIFHLLSIV